jgi:predicted O-methyltransferase YrrM
MAAGRPALHLARWVLRSRGRFDGQVVWIETRPYQSASVELDGLAVVADVAAVAWGRHPVLEAVRRELNDFRNQLEPRLECLEASLQEESGDPHMLIHRNAFLTGERARPLTVREDQLRLSLPLPFRRLLHRLARRLRPALALELGTAHGLTAAYLGCALHEIGAGRLHTIEGDPQRHARARANLESALPGAPVTCHLGMFDRVLPDLLSRLESGLDLVFDDGPHLADITLASYQLIAPHLAPGAVYAMDDIDYPTGNRRAWETIRSGPGVAAWVEINGRLGLCIHP